MKRIIILAALVLGTVGMFSPAKAGTGYSQWCNDGTGGGAREVSVINNPVTLGVEVDTSNSYVQICYSTNPNGTPGGIVGGVIQVIYTADASSVTVTGNVQCASDTGVNFGPACNTALSGVSAGSVTPGSTGSTTYIRNAGGPCLWVLGTQYLPTCTGLVHGEIANGDMPQVTTHSTGQCLLYVGGCQVYLSGVKVKTGQDTTNPGLFVQAPVVGSRTVDVPKRCAGVLVDCAPSEG